jgi:hypothetical protein
VVFTGSAKTPSNGDRQKNSGEFGWVMTLPMLENKQSAA